MTPPQTSNMLERLSVAGVLFRAFQILWQGLGTFLLCAGAAVIPMTLLLFWIGHVFQKMISDMIGGAMIDGVVEDPTGYITKLACLVIVAILVSAPAWLIASGACCRAVAEMYNHQIPSASVCLKKSIDRLVGLVGSVLSMLGVLFMTFLALLLAVAICIGVFSLFPEPVRSIGIFIGIILYFVYFVFVTLFSIRMKLMVPAVMIENKGPINALKRSWELSGYGVCFLICCYFFVGVIFILILAILIALLVDPSSEGGSVGFSLVVGFLPAFITLPFHAILNSVVYMNYRVEREGLNIEVLQQDLLGSAPPLDDEGQRREVYRPVDSVEYDDDRAAPFFEEHETV